MPLYIYIYIIDNYLIIIIIIIIIIFLRLQTLQKNNNKNSTISFNKKQPIVKSEAVKKGKPQLIITVEIGDGRVGEIHYYDQDEYKDLATRFCKRYNLRLLLLML